MIPPNHHPTNAPSFEIAVLRVLITNHDGKRFRLHQPSQGAGARAEFFSFDSEALEH
jgi:hypothetical protein